MVFSWPCYSVVEYLPAVHKALGFTPDTVKQNEKIFPFYISFKSS